MLYTLHDGIEDDVLRVTLPYFEGQAIHWFARQDLHGWSRGGAPGKYEWNHTRSARSCSR